MEIIVTEEECRYLHKQLDDIRIACENYDSLSYDIMTRNG